MTTPLPRTTFRPTKWALALLIVVLWSLLLARCTAATVVAGTKSYGVYPPFGVNSDGAPQYIGEYQQIYSAVLFPAVSMITQIGFMDVGASTTRDLPYNLSIGFGVTTRTPDAPGNDFATGATPVFFGSVAAHITATPGDFDFLIDLATPFLYDPSQGNLLLDVTVVSAAVMSQGGVGYTYALEDNSSIMAVIRDGRGGIHGRPNGGLVTQFTVTPVPELARTALLFLGAGLCILRRRCGKLVAVAAALCGLPTLHSAADTIIAGEHTTRETRPFRVNADRTASYMERAEFIYGSSLFTAPSIITQIGFSAYNADFAEDISYQLTLGLGVTSRTPALPGTGFESGATPVFSGVAVAHITPIDWDFDFLIDLSAPYFYDPALGSLLLDIEVISATGTPSSLAGGIFTFDSTANDIASIFVAGTSPVSYSSKGPYTQFIVNPVPEPATGALLLLGAVLCVPQRVRAPVRSS